MVFKARYAPEKWFIYDLERKTALETTSADGKPFTFFSFNGKLYGMPEAAMAAYAPSDTDLFTYSFSGKSWADVQTFAGKIKEDDPVGYRKHLLRSLGGKTLTATLSASEAAALGWSSYMKTTFGYSLENGKPVINQNGKETRRLLARYGLHTYADGVCYYPWWIRHSNNNASTKGIMEYAIVRNNIYKLRVSDIYGLGYDIPYEPPFDPEDPIDPPVDPEDPDPTPDPDPDPDPAQTQTPIQPI